MIQGALLDLSGVVHVGDHALPGAPAAIERLRSAGLPVGFITNTTRLPKPAIINQLAGCGVAIAPEELTTPAGAAIDWLRAQGRSAHLLVAPALESSFDGLDASLPPAVVLGDAADGFTYAALNAAFRLLTEGAPFLALARNRAFQDDDGKLSLDAGAFVTALEFASGTTALDIGKPAPAFFSAAVSGLGVPAADVVMVGDDAEADVSGALKAGIGAGLLTRTGKYRDGAEAGVTPAPTAVVEDLATAVDWILARRG